MVKKPDRQERKARWGATAGGITGVTTGGLLGAYVGAAHPETIGAYTGEALQKGIHESMESLEGEFGEGWKPKGYGRHTEPFTKGPFGPEEAKARLRLMERKALNKRVLKRVGKYSAVGAATLGTLGAAAGYASSKAGLHQQKALSELLDNLLEFNDMPEKKKLKEGLKSKLEELKGKKKGRISHAGGLSAKLDKLIQFQVDDDREPAYKHLRRTTLIGAGAGGAAFGLPAYSYLRRGIGVGRREAAAVAGLGGLKGAGLGAVAGLTVGALTKPRKLKHERLSTKLDNLIQFQDPRRRDRLGMFTGSEEGSPDPNAMVKTYRQGVHAGILQGAGSAAAGAAAGALSGHAVKSLIARIKAAKKAKNVPRIIVP